MLVAGTLKYKTILRTSTKLLEVQSRRPDLTDLQIASKVLLLTMSSLLNMELKSYNFTYYNELTQIKLPNYVGIRIIFLKYVY